ncbi:hypothetical protein Bca52824_024524 [Brassica carinata]|uniref:Uncharacterized protein n=1 Tax=Brassica carinata TaxID=52824 RepID=A0A8X8AVR4_BRACI|nr:hypothetical protein Bca52824_024524 [Brassica carinata]
MITLHGKVEDIPSYTSLFVRLGNKESLALRILFFAQVDNLPQQAIAIFAQIEMAWFKADLYTCQSVLAAYVRSNTPTLDAFEFLRKTSDVYKLKTIVIEYSCLIDKNMKSEGLEMAIE